MLTLDAARRLALSLPEATEQDHHGFPSFRVRGKIFATQPDASFLHVMAEDDEIRAAVAEDPGAFEEVWWGKRLSAVRVHLALADAGEVEELLIDAWRRKAPKTLVTAFDADRGGRG